MTGTARIIRADSRHLPSDADLGWLAGVIDGEGTVALVCTARDNPTLRISVYNTNDLLLDKIARILYGLGLDWSERVDNRPVEQGNRVGYAINLSTDSALRLYEHVRPHMVRQANRYDAAYWFLWPRLKHTRRYRWSDRERAIWVNLREVFNAR